ALREAKATTRAKASAVADTQAEIASTKAAVEAFRLECPKEPQAGQPDPDKAKRDGIKLLIKELEATQGEQETAVSKREGELATARKNSSGKAADLKTLDEKQAWSKGVREAKTAIDASKKKLLTKQKEQSEKIAEQERALAGV